MDYEEDDLETPHDVDISEDAGKQGPAQPDLPTCNWTRDEDSNVCLNCQAAFTLTKRRHHCRGCGKLLCAKCCNKWLLLPREVYPHDDPQRLCPPCYRKISIIDFEKTEAIGGPEDAPALVLVHDGIYNRSSWHIQMDILSTHFRVYAPDLPGHGSRMDETLTLKGALEVLKSLVDTKIPQKKAIFMGMGFGGLLSIVFAAQHPECVHGVIAAGACFNSSNAKLLYDLKGTLYKALSGGTLTGAPALEVDPRANPDLAVSLRYLMRAGFHYEAWSAIKNILTHTDFVQHAQQFDGKVWYVSGQNENRAAERKLLAASKNGLARLIMGGNHLMYWDPNFYPELHKYVVEFGQSLDLLATLEDHLGAEELVFSDDE